MSVCCWTTDLPCAFTLMVTANDDTRKCLLCRKAKDNLLLVLKKLSLCGDYSFHTFKLLFKCLGILH